MEVCTRALAHQRKLHDLAGLAGTLDSLGYICDNLGRPTEAIGWYREAITAYENDSDRSGEAATRTRLATTLASTGDAAAARTERELALAIVEDVDAEAAANLRDLLATDENT